VCVYCGGGRDSLDCHISSHTAFREAGPASTSLSHAASCCGNVSLLAWLFDRYPADEASLRDVDATKDEVLCVCAMQCGTVVFSFGVVCVRSTGTARPLLRATADGQLLRSGSSSIAFQTLTHRRTRCVERPLARSL
jgi:hypothetical protein